MTKPTFLIRKHQVTLGGSWRDAGGREEGGEEGKEEGGEEGRGRRREGRREGEEEGEKEERKAKRMRVGRGWRRGGGR